MFVDPISATLLAIAFNLHYKASQENQREAENTRQEMVATPTAHPIIVPSEVPKSDKSEKTEVKFRQLKDKE